MRVTCPAHISTFNLSTHEYFVRRNNHKTLQYKILPSLVLFIHLRTKHYPEHPLSLFYLFKIRTEMYFVGCILIFDFLDSRLKHKILNHREANLCRMWKKFCDEIFVILIHKYLNFARFSKGLFCCICTEN